MSRPIPGDSEEWMRDVEKRTHQSKPFRTPVGTYLLGVWATEPTGYKFADGQALDRVRYGALFAEIGTTYGAGDGTTTFNVPNIPVTNGVKYAIKV